MSRLSQVVSRRPKHSFLPSSGARGCIDITIDIHDALVALREDLLEGVVPDSLDYLSIDARLYAAFKAQRELSDADEYEVKRAEEILRTQGYDFSIVREPDVRWKNGNFTNSYIHGTRINDLVEIECLKHDPIEAIKLFEQLNKPFKGDVWKAERKNLLYIPESLIIRFNVGSEKLYEADISLTASDDPRWDEIPTIHVRKHNEVVLGYLL